MIRQWLRRRADRKSRAQALYFAAASQARQPVFYTAWGVPDTIDGRFEMAALHIFMVMKALKDGKDKDAAKLAQALFDRMFKVTDQAIREMGIGDLSVPRHMKRMMTAFNGRAYSYELALQGGQDLRDALRRNVYGTVPDVNDAALDALEQYVRGSLAALNKEGVMNGIARFADAAMEEEVRRHA